MPENTLPGLIIAFYAFAAGALLLLGFLFVLNRVSDKGNRWLGAFFWILACTFAELFFEKFRVGGALVIHLLELPRWAMLPCFYMAISHYVAPRVPKKAYLHFAPFVLFLVFSLFFLLPGLVSENPLPELPAWLGFLIRYFLFGQAAFYWIISLLLYRRHNSNIKMVSSFTEAIDLSWVRYLLISVLALILIRALVFLDSTAAYLSPVLYFFGVIGLAYLTITQKSIYATEAYVSAQPDEPPTGKVSHEPLTGEQVDALKEVILDRVSTGKLHLDPGLTLSVLSDKTGIGPHELSYVLNKGFGKNFYQFINELRTEEAKSLLLSDEILRFDMLGVATRSGFNSKTTFYTTFKKATGMTPKEFMKAGQEAMPAKL